MEPFSKALFICALTAALYQMSGTPFLLNIVIFCSCTLLCLYAMFISGFIAPTEALYDWFYDSKETVIQGWSQAEDRSTPEDSDHYDLNKTDDQITKRLRELTGHVVRDFILSWYNTVSEDVTFVQEAFEIFEHLLKESRAWVSGVNKEKLLSDILAELLKHYIIYQDAVKKAEVTGHQRSAVDAERKNQLIVIDYCEKHCHPVMANVPDSEMKHLRGLVVLLLKALLPHEYKLTETPLYIVRELVAQNVFSSLVDLMSDPLWIYNTLVTVLSEEDAVKESEDKENVVSLTEEAKDTENDHKCIQGDGTDGQACVSDLPQLQESGTDEASDIGQCDHGLRPASATSEDTLTGSQLSTSSCNSHFSDSLELDVSEQILSSMDEELPLPLTSLKTHFGYGDGHTDNNALQIPAVFTNPLSPISGLATPEPGRLFYRIRIPDSVTMQEGFEGGGKYTLYRVTYKTVKEKVNVPQQNSESTSGQEHGSATDWAGSREEDSFVKVEVVKHQVQRRFREFLALQERLAVNMVAKNLIADIRGPSRMFPVPFGNMDKDYIETRRKFLQAYLREMCSIPFVNNSKEMKEFLAYETDPRIAFVRKQDSLPRIDKIFRSAVQDLFGTTAMKFSSTLILDDDDLDAENEQLRNLKRRIRTESSSAESSNSKPGPVAMLKNMVLGSSAKMQTSLSRLERQFAFKASQPCTDRWVDVEDAARPLPRSSSSEMRFFRRTCGDGCDAPMSSVEGGAVENRVEADMVESVFRLLLHVWELKPGVHNVAVLSLSDFVQRYLAEKLNSLTSTESWTQYLAVLRDALWPDGTWCESGNDRLTWNSAPEHIRAKAAADARQALKKALPKALQSLVGEELFKKGVTELVDSFQHTAINKQLFYFLLDSIVGEVFTDMPEVVARENVFFSAVPIT